MQHNSIVIDQQNAAMAQLHKKCDFANFTLIFSFKLNSDDKRFPMKLGMLLLQDKFILKT